MVYYDGVADRILMFLSVYSLLGRASWAVCSVSSALEAKILAIPFRRKNTSFFVDSLH